MEVDQSQQTEATLNALASLICQLNAQNTVDYSSSDALFKSLGGGIKNTFNTLSRRPKPIANDLKLSKNEWDELDKAASLLTSDYKRRAELIIRRLDVTVDSFFWSERIQQLEQKVNNVYNSKREQIAEWQPLGASDVLAATEDLLVVEEASSYKQRIATKSDISNFTMKENPKDRGGRTGEIIAPIRETFGQQQHDRRGGGNSNRGGGRGRGGFQQYHNQRDNRQEHQVQQEYSGGGNQHHGRGRGHRRGNQGGGSGHRNRPY